MPCYLDKRFCSQPCANADCSRNFNDVVMAHARAWWGTEGEPPIDFSDMRTDECGFVPMNGDNKNA
ncbi:hypothetical protein [Nitrosomonas sp. Is79A3]|uniref:hypothetical protein n=1 Tax=Nitrosomonas sp. (strain Is79A3) TaxID=261292 RepID=UPI000315D326